MKNNVAILLKRLRSRDMALKQAKKPICTGLPRPGLARSAHRGRIKLLRGYVSKSSAALNRPTHGHAGSQPVRGRYNTGSRTALRGITDESAIASACPGGRSLSEIIKYPCAYYALSTYKVQV